MVLTLRDAQGCARATVLPQDCTPFSFEQCCRVCGYSPERLRDGLAALLPAIGLAETLREITRASAETAQVHARANSEPAAPAATIAAPQTPQTPQTPLATPAGASA